MSLALARIKHLPSVGRLSLVGAFKTIRPHVRIERVPTPTERNLLARLVRLLLPTVLRPFEEHRQAEAGNRPVAREFNPSGTEVEQRCGKQSASDATAQSYVAILTAFLDRMPSLSALEMDASSYSASSALTQALCLRMHGMEHKAVCILWNRQKAGDRLDCRTVPGYAAYSSTCPTRRTETEPQILDHRPSRYTTIAIAVMG